MAIINLTWHDINIVSQIDWQWSVTHTFKSEGCARVSFDTQEIDSIDGVKIFKSVAGQTQGLPEFWSWNTCLKCQHDCYADDGGSTCCNAWVEPMRFIVSKIVAEANPHRKDLLIVHETVRDGAAIIGCKGLAVL